MKSQLFIIIVVSTIFLTTRPSLADPPPQYQLQWGTSGSGTGQFNKPYGVACNSAGDVYVVDNGNQRIQVFDGDGGFLGSWGGAGNGQGRFNNPYGIAIDSGDNVYVADAGNYRVQKFDASGGFLTAWGSSGSGNGQFSFPQGIGIGPGDFVYVADTFNHRMQKFSSTGAYLTQWGSLGSGNGQFNLPRGVGVDDSYVYVVDSDNNRVQAYQHDGTFGYVFAGGAGSSAGQFNQPYSVGLGISPTGEYIAFVSDPGNHRVQVFARPSGLYLHEWGSPGNGDGQFTGTMWLGVDPLGNIFVSGHVYNRIQKFTYPPPPISVSRASWGKIKSRYR